MIHVVDAPCGIGKTSAAIEMMNTETDARYMFITPFLNEVRRVKESCDRRKFFEPQEMNTKLNGIHWLLSNNKDIASTHALFLNFNQDTVTLIKNGGYTLILDEVASVVEIMDITKKDLTCILANYATVKDGLLIWEDMEYEGKFSEIMRMSLNKCVGIYGDTALIWCFPIEIFKAFKDVYILTYMFKAQMQRYYYDFYNVQYDYMYVTHNGDKYGLTDKITEYDFRIAEIDICDSEKLNAIGDNYSDLSVSWFHRNKFEKNRPLINVLKNNMYNYFRNICKTPSGQNMWTTFKLFKTMLQGNGYSRGFVSVNARATNEYKHKTHLAYCANIFLNPVLKQFFNQKGIVVDEDLYALSELVQWMWRSAIRDGRKISIYIPSARMRQILTDWLQSENIKCHHA